MQPWPDQGQNGADGHDAWHSGFIFPAQSAQFDPGQEQWPNQPTAAFSQIGHELPDASAQDYDFDAVHHVLADQHLSNPQSGQSGFYGAAGHASMPLGQHQQFPSADQDMLDPAFTSMHPDLFGSGQQQQQHQPKAGLAGAAMAPITQNHGQVFPQHDYSFTPQSGQSFNPTPGPAQPPQYSPLP